MGCKIGPIASDLDVEIVCELVEIQAKSIGRQPLEQGAYLHVSDANASEVLVVGVPQAGDAVLLVG